jgi:dTDP-4-dehydrorhamnose 3,5-epimerase
MVCGLISPQKPEFSTVIKHTVLSGVVLLTPARVSDISGWCSETWNVDLMRGVGPNLPFVQDNHSMSGAVGTLRGLHYQRPPHAQDKLVRCTWGAMFNVAVDIRRGSPTYGQWVGVELTAANGKQLLVPKGFLHGFVTRMPDTEVQYKCTDVYAPDCDGAIRWDDPTIGIDWGLTSAPVLSAKDATAPLFADFDSPFIWEGAE